LEVVRFIFWIVVNKMLCGPLCLASDRLGPGTWLWQWNLRWGFPLSPTGLVIVTIVQSTLAHLGMTSRSAKGEAWGNYKGFGRSPRAVGIFTWHTSSLGPVRSRRVALQLVSYIHIVNSSASPTERSSGWTVAVRRHTVENKVDTELSLLFKSFHWLRRPQLVATIPLSSLSTRIFPEVTELMRLRYDEPQSCTNH
jgi:hypothetical protein